ncbi:MAG: beta-phosphoglucomutase family hydrolase [Candidatus Omnitrophica bacterium]|nr:beta-phosphoglucomutase family hydrolase [Candidatus Omnitrophota bacterium]
MMRAAIFDMDGVIVDTVPLHFKAWKRMFGEHGIEFGFEDYKEKVDGIPRIDGARAILKDLPEEGLKKACDNKQVYFLQYLKEDKIPVYESTIDAIRNFLKKGIKVAAISSSKNCKYILDTIGISKELDAIVDGYDITKGKPDPQVFLLAAERVKVEPPECLVFEDAVLGVEAAKNGGMVCVGIDRYNDPSRLKKADVVVEDLSKFDYKMVEELFKR